MAEQKKVSLDSAFKSAIRNMELPTKKDLEKLQAKIDRLEKLLRQTTVTQKAKTTGTRSKAVKSSGARESATDIVLDKIKRSKNPVDFTALQNKTGFEEKKLRNIIFRLNKLGKIKRVGRGQYEATTG